MKSLKLKALALIVLGGPLFAASVEIRDIGPAVAHAYIKGSTGPCKWNLYEGGTATGTPHPDVVAVVDTSRSDTFYDEFGTRVMRLGHDYGDFPLAVNTQYTLARDPSDTGCVGLLPITFTTYTQPPPVSTRAFLPRWNPNTYSGMWTPTYDWTIAGRNKLYTVPVLGTRYSFFQQAGADNYAFYDNYTVGFTVTGGGTWTNAGNAGNGSPSSAATIPDTSKAVLIPDMTWQYNYGSGVHGLAETYSFENLGLVSYGGCSGTTGTNCQIKACITIQSAVSNPSCYGSGFTIDVPVGSVAQILSSSTDVNKPFPNEFGDFAFAGWGGALLTRDRAGHNSSVTSVVNGVVTGGGVNSNDYFSDVMKDNFIYIPNSAGACGVTNMCAVESVQSPTQLTLVDKTVNLSGGQLTGQARTVPFGVILQRVSASAGTVSFGARMVAIGHSEDLQSANSEPECHTKGLNYTAPSGEAIPGHLCYSQHSHFPVIYFVPDDPRKGVHPIVRIKELARNNGTATTISPSHPEDNWGEFAVPFGYDPNNGNILYAPAPCNFGGSMCIYRLTIRDWSPQYAKLNGILNQNGPGVWESRRADAATAGDVLVENITSPSAGTDLASRIAADPANAWTTQGIYAYSGYTSAPWRLNGISGQMAMWGKWPTTASQDNWPLIIAVQDLGNSGNIVRVFSSHYDGEPGGIPEMRGGMWHAWTSEPALSNAFSFTANYPANNGSSSPGFSYFGARIIMKPTAVLRSGVWSSNVALGRWPFTSGADNDYDKTCPSDLPTFVADRAYDLSSECVSIEFEAKQCFEALPNGSSSALYGRPVCGWNSGYTEAPWSVLVGDRYTQSNCASGNCNFWTTNDHMMVGKMLAGAPAGKVRVVMLRNSAWDFSCAKGSKPSDKSNCQEDIIGGTGASWVASLTAGRNESKGSTGWVIQFATDGSYQISEDNAGLSGHSARGFGLTSSTLTHVGNGFTAKNLTLSNFQTKFISGLPVANRALRNGEYRFSGTTSAVQQAYLNRKQDAGYASQWTMDVNHINDPNYGLQVGAPRNFVPIANCGVVAGLPTVYKIDPLQGGYPYKTAPLFGYAGHKILEDVSGPNVDICNAHDFSMVYVQRSSDSIGITLAANGRTPAVGDIYVKVPAADISGSATGCWTREPWRNDPCVMFLGDSRAGALRRFWSEEDDMDGKYSQTLLTMGPQFPGNEGYFSKSYTTPSGRSNIMTATVVGGMEGVRTPALFVHLPPFSFTRDKQTLLVNSSLTGSMANASITVPYAAGATHARIRFGFDPTTFYCSGRREACVTDSEMDGRNILDGSGNIIGHRDQYAYIGETLNPHAFNGATSISIPLPIDLGRAFYYRIEWLKSGVIIKQSAVKPIVVN